MKKGVILFFVLILLSSFVYGYSTIGPTESDNSNQTTDFSEATGSVTGIHPLNYKYGNTIAILILAFMGVALFVVLSYCKKNI